MEPQVVSDSDLVSRCRQGDLSAFEGLYQRYRLPLYSYLNRLVSGQSQTADDLFQQTWVKVLDNLARYSEQQRFVSWLFRIAHNVAVDHHRRGRQRESVEVTEDCAVDDSAPWEALDREVLREAVEAATATLSPEQREVVLLRQRGLSFKEIAVIQKSSINTVLGRMHYAVQHLRRRLARYR
ncbi:MAG: sigma-70 family RNA polymerase sigma factor [Lentisphaerae bacterium]|nr:sigma-70 family RNA polymerase sigma factor [Lentisphaerota bacterium]